MLSFGIMVDQEELELMIRALGDEKLKRIQTEMSSIVGKFKERNMKFHEKVRCYLSMQTMNVSYLWWVI